jgi:hypothetical protein
MDASIVFDREKTPYPTAPNRSHATPLNDRGCAAADEFTMRPTLPKCNAFSRRVVLFFYSRQRVKFVSLQNAESGFICRKSTVPRQGAVR